ncbi:aminotransferase class V-fold PLP-dependent enzyme [Robiginitalea sp. M366]|uniref:aminotransferase class V-fold PLP-dependent enzyme n=1 Tax=Robiginitalea aestuariiviva TaxID=3036903 RepID=UPI00240DBFC2|nr:aminotransferase class V-fold PLP-dependent enzyme [Robiginitalea aestuariiviva]MDG1572543.1 aminotransferase class V-fold PLP-dependent enzyme [Robiginitalea aestuariiviva]
MDKRHFLRHLGVATLASPLLLSALPSGPAVEEPWPDPSDEAAFWARVRLDYELKPDYINLESGYYNIIPRPTLQYFLEQVRMVNYEGSHYMRTVQWENKKQMAARLAALINAPADTVVITRNTTESLDLVIGGYPWKQGDEAVFAEQDYGAMQMQFQQVAARHGVVNRVVSLPQHPTSDEEIVALYEAAITPRTRLLMVCHMVNITGQILPVRKICDMAHRHGVEVMVDGAHSVAHHQVDLQALDCDYYGSSLHKWLATPLGAGLLYVKKPHISKIWPLLAEHHREPSDIGRLNHTGTHPVHTDLAIAASLDYLERLGPARKEARLRALQRYWTEQLRGVSGVLVNTPEDPARHCGIGNVGIEGMDPVAMAKDLLEHHGIFTVGIRDAGVWGCRITPNVFTTHAELDQLVEAVTQMARTH